MQLKETKNRNGLIEHMRVIGAAWNHSEQSQCHIESRTQEPPNDDSPVMPWLVEHARMYPCPGVRKGRDGKTPYERLHGKKPTQEFVPFGEKVLARTITTYPMNRMNTRYQNGIWLGVRNNSAECFIGNADGVFRAREIRRLEPQDRWDIEAVNYVIQKRRNDKRSTGRRGEKGRAEKRRRSDRAAAEVTETESSAPAASGQRENPIEPDPNPKRKSIMKSA